MSTDQKKLRIINIGAISSGKTSLLCALTGNLSSPTAKKAETAKPYAFNLSTEGTIENAIYVAKQVSAMKTKNKEIFADLKNAKTQKEMNDMETEIGSVNKSLLCKPILSDLNIEITDFPGFGDNNDRNGQIMKAFTAIYSQYDVINYVCDAEQPFIREDQVTSIRKVIDLIEKSEEETQTNIKLLITVTKYDDFGDEEDEELKDMYENIPKQILSGITIEKTKKKYTIPKSDIYRVNNYLMFAARCHDKFYVAPESKQEMSNITKNLFGRKFNLVVTDGAWVKPKKFKNLNVCNGKNGDWDGLVSRLKSMTEKIDEFRVVKLMKLVMDQLDSDLVVEHDLDECDENYAEIANGRLGKYLVGLRDMNFSEIIIYDSNENRFDLFVDFVGKNNLLQKMKSTAKMYDLCQPSSRLDVRIDDENLRVILATEILKYYQSKEKSNSAKFIKTKIKELISRGTTNSYVFVLEKIITKITETTNASLLRELISLYDTALIDLRVISRFNINIEKHIEAMINHVIDLLFKDTRKYVSFLAYDNMFLPEISTIDSSKNRYHLLKKYLDSFPKNKEEAKKIFLSDKDSTIKNLIYIFFAPKSDLLTLRQYKKLDPIISFLTNHEKHLVYQFMDDPKKDHSENIGTQLFSKNNYYNITDECKEIIK
jgi:GTPase SAR1 family protein